MRDSIGGDYGTMGTEDQYLLVNRPGKPSEVVSLDPAKTYTLGRAPDCQIVLADASVSRQHARIAPRENAYWVEDLQSKNGTKLNGKLIQQRERLSPGDKLEFGPIVILFSGQERKTARLGDTGAPGHMTAVPVLELVGSPGSETRIQALQALPPQRVGYLLQSVDRVGRELLQHRPLADLLQFVVELTSEVVRADRSVLLMREGDDLAVRAVRHAGSGLGGDIIVSRSIARKTMEEKQAILTSDAQHDPRFKEQQSIIRQRIHSAMCVPLWHEDHVLGVLYVDNIAAPFPFADEDLRILTLIGHLAAVKIRETEVYEDAEKKKMFEEELRRAASIQNGLLPSEPLIRPPFHIAGRNLPSQDVGGDYFDFIECEGGGVCVALGDVAGKGMPAALLMANLHANVRAQVETGRPLPEMIGRVNRAICRAVRGSGRFITFVMAALDSSSGHLRYVNAGHNLPVLLRAGGAVEKLERGGLILGVSEDETYEMGELVMAPGDLLVLYSDGVTDAMDARQDQFGDDRLEGFIRDNRGLAPEAFVDALIQSVLDFSEGKPGDDVTVAVIRAE